MLEKDHTRRDHIKSLLADGGHTSFCFEKISICLDNLASLNPDLVILGSPRAPQAFRFLYAIDLIGMAVPVLILSDRASIAPFVALNGYNGWVTISPELVPADIDPIIKNHNQRQGGHGRALKCPIIVGNTAELVHIKKLIPDLSRTREKLLIVGERGSGRELLAQAIHGFGGGPRESFLKISPGGLQQLVDNRELLMRSPDARRRAEPVTGVDHRTIFIGDVDEVPEHQQLFLFYLLQVTDVQSGPPDQPNPASFRIIASAKSNLEKMVDNGLFRKGLYYRLNVIHIDLPPLRDRANDIPLLIDFFADQASLELRKSFLDISADTKASLSNYFWEGNVQELKNVVKRMVTDGDEKGVAAALSRKTHHRPSPGSNRAVEDIYALAELSEIKNYLTDLSYISLKDICQEFITRIEKKLMAKALMQANGNRKKAASMLDISYKSLLNKIKDYNL